MRVIGKGTHGSIIESGNFAFKRILYKDETGISTVCLRELDAFKELRHPNVMHCLSIRSSLNYIYLEMDYIPYTLGSYTYGCKLDMVQIRSVIVQLLQGMCTPYRFVSPYFSISATVHHIALHYMHDMHYLHRDVKPDNILIQSSGIVKLSDFGTPRSKDPPTSKFHIRHLPLSEHEQGYLEKYNAGNIHTQKRS